MNGDPSWPKVLHYTISIGQENPDIEGTRLEAIGQYLERKMGMPVVVTGTTGYGVTIEAFRAKKIEASTMGPFGYVIGATRAGIEAIATRGTPEGKLRTYSGTLAVAAGSPLRSMDDVVRHAHELTVSFVDPASTSGNLLQRAYLQSLGLQPERDFKKVVYSIDHVTSALTVRAGKVDVAAVSETALAGLFQSNKIRREDIRILWTSPPVPESLVAIRKDLPERFKHQLQLALLNMAAEAPDAYRNMTAKVYMERYRNTKFVPATDATYDPVRAVARGVTQLDARE